MLHKFMDIGDLCSKRSACIKLYSATSQQRPVSGLINYVVLDRCVSQSKILNSIRCIFDTGIGRILTRIQAQF